MDDRLYRSRTDRVIAGVAGGMAAWLQIDPSLVRVAWVLLAIFSFGIMLVVYLVMMIVVPLAPEGWVPSRGRGTSPGSGAVPGWGAPAGAAGAAAAPGPGAGPGSSWQQAAPGPQGVTWQQVPPQPSWPSAEERAARRRLARMVVGTLFVLFGVWLLVDQYVAVDLDLLWPLLVIGAGVVLVGAALMRAGGRGT